MNLKTILAVLLSVALILAGGWLPGLVGDRMDARNENQVLFTPVEGIRLEFGHDNALSTRQLVALMSEPRDWVDIPVELASLSQVEVLRIAETTAQRYESTGILLASMEGGRLLYSSTFLAYGQNSQNNVFWGVGYGTADGKYFFHFNIDDATGLVTSVEYVTGGMAYDGTQVMEYVLSQFCQQYLTSLGEEFLDYKAADIMAGAKAPQDGSYLAAEMPWTDENQVERKVTFFVNNGGFFTHFS